MSVIAEPLPVVPPERFSLLAPGIQLSPPKVKVFNIQSKPNSSSLSCSTFSIVTRTATETGSVCAIESMICAITSRFASVFTTRSMFVEALRVAEAPSSKTMPCCASASCTPMRFAKSPPLPVSELKMSSVSLPLTAPDERLLRKSGGTRYVRDTSTLVSMPTGEIVTANSSVRKTVPVAPLMYFRIVATGTFLTCMLKRLAKISLPGDWFMSPTLTVTLMPFFAGSSSKVSFSATRNCSSSTASVRFAS